MSPAGIRPSATLLPRPWTSCENRRNRPTMSEPTEASKERPDRLSTVITVLIALVSTIIALVASQSAVAAGNSTEAQHNGVIAKINLERVDGGSWAQVARNQRAFSDYRFNRDLYFLTFNYINQAEAGGNAALGTALRLEATGQLEESNNAFQYIDSGYLIADDAGEYVGFDEATYLADRRQSASVTVDTDFEDDFAEAARWRTQALYLGATLFVWFLSLTFLTWAEITKSALRWVWLVAGLLVALALVAAYTFSGMINALGLG